MLKRDDVILWIRDMLPEPLKTMPIDEAQLTLAWPLLERVYKEGMARAAQQVTDDR